MQKLLHHQLLVRISDFVEMGCIQYVEEHKKLGLPCCSPSLSSPGKRKTRRVPVSPVAAEKLNCLLQAILHLKLLSRRALRIRVQKEVVAIVAIPRSSRGI